MTQNTHFINGQWLVGKGQTMSSTDPAKNILVWEGKAASTEQVEQAVKAARTAFIEWSQRSFDSRLAVVKTFASLLEENKTEFAHVIAKETGKPQWETATEVAAMIGKV